MDSDDGAGLRKKNHRDGLDLDDSALSPPRMEDLASPREAQAKLVVDGRLRDGDGEVEAAHICVPDSAVESASSTRPGALFEHPPASINLPTPTTE